MKRWLLAARPKTLSAAWVPVFVGTALAWKNTGVFLGWVFACTLISSLLIQIATNFLNDAIDFEKGTDTEARLGPKRMTQTGSIGYNEMLRAGFLCLFFASIIGLFLVFRGGVSILLVGIISAFLAYGYTGGPWPLAYKGFGDLFVLLFFGLISVCGTYYLQTLNLDFFSKDFIIVLIAGLQVGLLAVVLIAINNFRDAEQDQKTDKKTLAVRFGPRFMRAEILFCLFVPLFLSVALFSITQLWTYLLPLLLFPLSLKIARDIWINEPSPYFNLYLAKAGVNHTLFGLILSVGILFS